MKSLLIEIDFYYAISAWWWFNCENRMMSCDSMKAWEFDDQDVEATEEKSIRLITSMWCDLKVKNDSEETFHKFESSHS